MRLIRLETAVHQGLLPGVLGDCPAQCSHCPGRVEAVSEYPGLRMEGSQQLGNPPNLEELAGFLVLVTMLVDWAYCHALSVHCPG